MSYQDEFMSEKRRKLLEFAKMEQFAIDIFIKSFKDGGMKKVYSNVGKKFKYKKPYKIACEAAAECHNYHSYAYDWYRDLGFYINGAYSSYFNHEELIYARKQFKEKAK